jgi:hypothetical protein
LLKVCSELRKHKEYERVFVTPDLTRKQQEADKVLRGKLKEFKEKGETNLKIKKGKVVKNLIGREDIVLYPLPAGK